MSHQYVAWTPDRISDSSFRNRRAYVRYQCGLATPGRLKLQSEEWLRAWVLDLSVTGAGLLLSRRVEAGLTIVLHLVDTVQKKVHEIPACIRHATCQSDGDWLIGCEFSTKLTDDELDALLA